MNFDVIVVSVMCGRRNLDNGSTVISSNDRDLLFLTWNVWIPEEARCFPDHIILRLFTQQALDSINPFSIRYQEWNSSDLETLLERPRTLYKRKEMIQLRRFS